ncbi:MalY/PatB family protein [Candidatus Bipolaricaulota bacterium]
MAHDFERIIERRQTESIKWNRYDEGVLPMWVADMDFLCPPAVIEALRKRVDHGIFGYAMEPPELREIIVDRLKRRYDWAIYPDWITFPPNVFVGFHLAAHAICEPGDGVSAHTPIYFPILLVPENVKLQGQLSELERDANGRYTIDFDAFEDSLDERSRLFILCNPHNPIGRVYTQSELERIAEICLRHDLHICSDEIHADFVYDGGKHTPIASPEIADRTITLFSPVKSFNIAGISFSFTVIPNGDLRQRYDEAKQGLVTHPGVMGYTAAVPALRDSDDWFDELLPYLQENRDVAARFVAERVPGVSMTPLEGTYLAWLDCRQAQIAGTPHEFFLEQAKVATVDGGIFGAGGKGFARLNLACPRERLLEGLERMRVALDSL